MSRWLKQYKWEDSDVVTKKDVLYLALILIPVVAVKSAIYFTQNPILVRADKILIFTYHWIIVPLVIISWIPTIISKFKDRKNDKKTRR
jgi:NADH:ubiquinone oxidoreductase subunit 6 (subunit J)